MVLIDPRAVYRHYLYLTCIFCHQYCISIIFAISGMSFSLRWEKQRPRGLPWGFGRDKVAEPLCGLRDFGRIDYIAQEALREPIEPIVVVLHRQDAQTELLVWDTYHYVEIFTFQSPLISLAISALSRERGLSTGLVTLKSALVKPATESNHGAYSAWDAIAKVNHIFYQIS